MYNMRYFSHRIQNGNRAGTQNVERYQIQNIRWFLHRVWNGNRDRIYNIEKCQMQNMRQFQHRICNSNRSRTYNLERFQQQNMKLFSRRTQNGNRTGIGVTFRILNGFRIEHRIVIELEQTSNIEYEIIFRMEYRVIIDLEHILNIEYEIFFAQNLEQQQRQNRNHMQNMRQFSHRIQNRNRARIGIIYRI